MNKYHIVHSNNNEVTINNNNNNKFREMELINDGRFSMHKSSCNYIPVSISVAVQCFYCQNYTQGISACVFRDERAQYNYMRSTKMLINIVMALLFRILILFWFCGFHGFVVTNLYSACG